MCENPQSGGGVENMNFLGSQFSWTFLTVLTEWSLFWEELIDQPFEQVV